jgi:type III secretory pathway component EscU
MFRSMYSCCTLLVKVLFHVRVHVQIIELESRLTPVKNELKRMKEDVVTTKKEGQGRRRLQSRRRRRQRGRRRPPRTWWLNG